MWLPWLQAPREPHECKTPAQPGTRKLQRPQVAPKASGSFYGIKLLVGFCKSKPLIHSDTCCFLQPQENLNKLL